MDSEKTLLSIVKTWNINPKPEYRGFRCANCQKYMHKAWHHLLTSDGYISPVHFCNSCEQLFDHGKLRITKLRNSVNKNILLDFPKNIEQELESAVKKWNLNSKPIYKIFTCDLCSKNLFKAYHVWSIHNNKLIEVHFCKSCGDTLDLNQ